MLKRSVLVLLLFFVGASFSGQAAAQLRPWEISIVGGPSFPTGDFDDFADTGYHVQGSVGFGLPLLPFGLRGDLLWQELQSESDGWHRQIGVMGNAIFNVPSVIIHPYALAGLGYMNTDADEADDESTLGLNIGLGVTFPLAGLSGVLELRYLNLVGTGDASDLRTIPISVGIRF